MVYILKEGHIHMNSCKVSNFKLNHGILDMP